MYLFNHPSDEQSSLRSAVTLPAGSVDSDYPLANLFDGNPARPCKLSGTWRVVIDMGTSTAMGLVSPLGLVAVAGAVLTWQGNATDSWGSPTVSLAAAAVAVDGDGYVNAPFFDCTGLGSFRYWSLVLTSSASAVEIGLLWLGATKRTPTHNYAWGTGISDDRTVVHQVTPGGVDLSYEQAGRRRRIKGTIETTDAGFALLQAWHRAARGSLRPFLFIPDRTVKDAWHARFVTDELLYQPTFINCVTIPFELLETSRGMRP